MSLKERVSKLEQLLLNIAPEQAKTILGENAGKKSYTHSSSNRRGGNFLSPVKQSDSDNEEDGTEDGGEEAEKAAFALESIAVAGREPMVSLFHWGSSLSDNCWNLFLLAVYKCRRC